MMSARLCSLYFGKTHSFELSFVPATCLNILPWCIRSQEGHWPSEDRGDAPAHFWEPIDQHLLLSQLVALENQVLGDHLYLLCL